MSSILTARVGFAIYKLKGLVAMALLTLVAVIFIACVRPLIMG